MLLKGVDHPGCLRALRWGLVSALSLFVPASSSRRPRRSRVFVALCQSPWGYGRPKQRTPLTWEWRRQPQSPAWVRCPCAKGCATALSAADLAAICYQESHRDDLAGPPDLIAPRGPRPIDSSLAALGVAPSVAPFCKQGVRLAFGAYHDAH
jgi:hypothetical protein